MQDMGKCPYCQRKFEVTQYGYGIACPYCRRRVNIFPDTNVFVHTRSGTYGIALDPKYIPESIGAAVASKSLFSSLLGMFKLLRWRWD